MITDSNLEAHIGALLFLAAAGSTLACALAALILAATKNWRGLRIAATIWGGGAAVYLALFLAFCLVSREIVLPLGEEKHFCELDCHIAISVVGVDRGILTLKTRFDEATISPHRGNGYFTPDIHAIIAIGADEPRSAVELPPVTSAERPAGTPLRPGESYLTRYRIPDDLNQKLFVGVGDGDFPQKFVIGNEAGFPHKKAYFALR